MARKKSTDYTGALAEPVKIDHPARAEDIARAIAKAHDKLPELAAHLGLDPGVIFTNPLILALRLAERHVPGFQIEARRPRSRPKEKTGEYLLQLMLAREQEAFVRGNHGAAARVARAFGEAQEAAAAKQEGRQVKKAAAKKKADQITNDLTRLNHPAIRTFADLLLTGLREGIDPKELASKMSEYADRVCRPPNSQKAIKK